jgi:hypothetical protein
MERYTVKDFEQFSNVTHYCDVYIQELIYIALGSCEFRLVFWNYFCINILCYVDENMFAENVMKCKFQECVFTLPCSCGQSWWIFAHSSELAL